MNGWILHKKEMGEVYETDILVEEFELSFMSPGLNLKDIFGVK